MKNYAKIEKIEKLKKYRRCNKLILNLREKNNSGFTVNSQRIFRMFSIGEVTGLVI